MTEPNQIQSSRSVSTNNNDRSQIRAYNQTSRFRVGDRVKVIQSDGSREGPYLVASIPSTGVYTVSFANGQEAQNGDEIEENDLEAA